MTKVAETTVPATFREVYPLNEPYAYAAVTKDPVTGVLKYVVIEPTLREEEKKILVRIKELLVSELDVNLRVLGSRDSAEQYLREFMIKLVKKYRIAVEREVLDKLMYYLIRDFIFLSKIDPLMRDHLIEDVSCDGVAVPVYIWHREYESIPTNVIFENASELDSFVTKLAYLSGRHISIATPVVDASLPDGSRVQLTYGKEVTRRGSTFSIRRFRADPITISDLLAFKTVSPEMAAFFWLIVERKASMLIVGGTASGKTTSLNALSMFIIPEAKIVSIEDTAELNLPHENWIQSVSRTGFGVAGGPAEISLFDLLKAAMRQRPDYIIVGEVRGEEAYTLFQAMATGHGGLSSTHADSAMAAINRLEAVPMNVPRPLLSTLDLIIVQSRVRLGEKSVRRMVHVAEIVTAEPGREVILNEAFRWDPRSDTFTYSGESYTIRKIIEKSGLSQEQVNQELQRRKTVIEWMVRSGVRRYKEVGAVIRDYYSDPERTYERAKLGLFSS